MATSNINIKGLFVMQVFHTVQYPVTCMVFGFGQVLLLMDKKRQITVYNALLCVAVSLYMLQFSSKVIIPACRPVTKFQLSVCPSDSFNIQNFECSSFG